MARLKACPSQSPSPNCLFPNRFARREFREGHGFSRATGLRYDVRLQPLRLNLKPTRRIAPPGTYFVTTSTQGGRNLLQRDAVAELFVKTLYGYRSQQRFQLHAFVVMPDHVHLIITPAESLERAMQFIKGGFSFQLSRQLGAKSEVWARGFTDHRIRAESDFVIHRKYIHLNPVRRGLAERPEQYRYSSASGAYEVDVYPSAAKAVSSADAVRHG